MNALPADIYSFKVQKCTLKLVDKQMRLYYLDTQLKGGARLCLLNMALTTALRCCLVARRSLGIIPRQPARPIRWNRRTTSRAASAYSKQEGNALFDILERNKDTEIGKRWNFEDITTIDGYREQVPLTTYGVYQEYIDRIVNKGEQNLLTADEVVAFAPSSGTTGLMKLVPITQAAIDKFDDADTTLRNLLLSSFFIKESSTPSGMPIQSISIGVYKRALQRFPNSYFVPREAYGFQPLSASLYAQLVFGLKDTSVDVIKTNFIPVLMSVMALVKSSWRQLVYDVRSGSIDSSLPIPSECRDVLNEKLGGPSPARADQLREIFEQAESCNFKDVIPAIWPNVKMIQCACSGSYKSFVPILKHYCGPNVHISSFVLACSEAGTYARVYRPTVNTSLFELVPHMFFEFIPFADISKDHPQALLSSEVQEGQVYELVLTTTTGFYRYRLGDLIKVVKLTNDKGSLFDLYGRSSMELVLTAQDHFFYESHLVEIMTEFISDVKSQVEYIASIDTTTYDRYIVWIESSECSVDSSTLAEFIDGKLQDIDSAYRDRRNEDVLKAMVVIKLKEGTFSKITEFMKSKTLGAEVQLKIPRVVINQEVEKILKENII